MLNPAPPLQDDHDDLHRPPSSSEIFSEMGAIGKICFPTAVTGLVLYSRAMISMLFLGYLGELQLAGGSLSIGFTNITGYSVLSGLAMGMEPICGQAFGARRRHLLSLTLHRTILLLLVASLPISFLWLNIRRILLWLNQDDSISTVAATFATAAIPDLLFLSFLHPLRIYLRSQNLTLPVAACSAASVAVHIPLNYFLVIRLRMGVAGVAFAMAWTNLNTVICLLFFVLFVPGPHRAVWVRPGPDAFRGWAGLLRLSLPSCASVCLEWWWYELMILLCGLLSRPQAAVASMGILIQTTSLVYVFPSSLSLAVSTRVGNELGAGRPRNARIAASVAISSAFVLGIAAMAFTSAVRNRWGKMFTRDREILELTAAALPIAGLCELGNCPQTTGCGVLRGSARPTTGANINFGSFYLVGTPVAVLMGFVVGFGFIGLWVGLLAAQATCAVWMGWVLVRMDWVAEVAKAGELTELPTPSVQKTQEKNKGDGDDEMMENIEGSGGAKREAALLISDMDPLIIPQAGNRQLLQV
ncbi:protein DETOXIFICATION 48 [Dendrobium catenatum]|nr:protein DETOXIFICATION 48 [Dendrobium catenatum]